MTNERTHTRAYLPEGFRVGHWTDSEARTGCTVILCPPGTVGGCDVRGNSPGSRELALLASEKSMQEVHALLLTGGSAFGLSAADGVMRYLEEQGVGYATPWVRVPIVPAAVIFDLNVGSSSIRPDAQAGYDACRSATAGTLLQGCVGVGTGATVGKWAGFEYHMTGGVGAATEILHDVVVSAIAAVNALGDVYSDSGEVLAGARDSDGVFWSSRGFDVRPAVGLSGTGRLANTTLVAVVTNASLTKVDANRLAQRGHDGMARAIRPVHTSFDGDVVFALASGQKAVVFDLLAEMAAEITARAIRAAVATFP